MKKFFLLSLSFVQRVSKKWERHMRISLNNFSMIHMIRSRLGTSSVEIEWEMTNTFFLLVFISIFTMRTKSIRHGDSAHKIIIKKPQQTSKAKFSLIFIFVWIILFIKFNVAVETETKHTWQKICSFIVCVRVLFEKVSLCHIIFLSTNRMKKRKTESNEKKNKNYYRADEHTHRAHTHDICSFVLLFCRRRSRGRRRAIVVAVIFDMVENNIAMAMTQFWFSTETYCTRNVLCPWIDIIKRMQVHLCTHITKKKKNTHRHTHTHGVSLAMSLLASVETCIAHTLTQTTSHYHL